MFELSLVELLFIGVIALVVIGPQDLPKALTAVLRLFRQVRGLINELRKGMDSLVDESGLKDVEKDVHYIIDDNGLRQPTYDISEFLTDEETPKTRVLTEKDIYGER